MNIFFFNSIVYFFIPIKTNKSTSNQKPSITSVHSSTNLSIRVFLQTQLLESKCSPIPLDLSHSQSQLLGFQLNPLSHTLLSIKSSLHSHLHLSSLHICLLLQTLEVNLHAHLQVSCQIICLASLILYIRLNTLTFMLLTMSGIHNLVYGSLILLQLLPHLFILML